MIQKSKNSEEKLRCKAIWHFSFKNKGAEIPENQESGIKNEKILEFQCNQSFINIILNDIVKAFGNRLI